MESIINRIGLRRLFDAQGCSLSGREDLTLEFVVSESFLAEAYFGPNPKHGIKVDSGSPRYLVPGETQHLGTMEIKGDARSSSYPRSFFVEILVSAPAQPLSSEAGTAAAQKELLEQADEMKADFENVIDLVSGIIGLRFHRQFVLQPLDQLPFAWEGETPHRGHAWPVWEILEPLALNDNGIEVLKALTGALAGFTSDARARTSLIFHWLLRAWREDDAVYRFVALFVPMEAILSGLKLSNAPREPRSNSGGTVLAKLTLWIRKCLELFEGKAGALDSKEQKVLARAIRKAIRRSGAENQGKMLRFFNGLALRSLNPSLEERFSAFAQHANLPGWQGDIEAFRRFNRMRNALVHRGDIEIQHRLTVGKNKEVRSLSDLVERYACYRIFGDTRVYESRWRPKINGAKQGDRTGC